MDRLAREGVLFETAVSPTSWTLPAHLTLLTALPSEEHGVIDDRMGLSREAVTLAEVLRDAGYLTAGFVSGPYLTGSYGFYQGFDHYDDYTVCACSAPMELSLQGATSPGLATLVSDYLRRWQGAGKQRPFFVFLHMWDVHHDYAPPPPYDTMFDPEYTGSITAADFEASGRIHKDMDPRDLEHIVALYDGEIRYTDHYLGKIFGVLESLRELDNTVVVVTSDHGDEFFEHGQKGHRKSLYDEVGQVPLIVRYPLKIPAGRRVSRQVRLMDVAPTILALAGVPQPEDFGGALDSPHREKNLLPWVADESAAAESLMAFGELEGRMAYIRTDRIKMILSLRGDGRQEVYDLIADRDERFNMAGRETAVDVALLQELLGFRNLFNSADALSEAIEPTKEHLEVLRSLGYVR